ncbi:glycosyltransferase, partial [Mycolicibacterium thermoresistibile]
MKFALACYGTRGDVEPSVSIGRELRRRGHDVSLAVPPDLVDFVAEADLAATPYGPPLQDFLREDFLRNFWTRLFRNPFGSLRELWAPIAEHWAATSSTLTSLAQGVDLLSTGLNFEQPAANVAEYYGIPLVALHHFPMRPNGRLVPALPPALVRGGGEVADWLFWRA